MKGGDTGKVAQTACAVIDHKGQRNEKNITFYELHDGISLSMNCMTEILMDPPCDKKHKRSAHHSSYGYCKP